MFSIIQAILGHWFQSLLLLGGWREEEVGCRLLALSAASSEKGDR